MKILIRLTFLASLGVALFSCDQNEDLGEFESFESCDYLRAKVGTTWTFTGENGFSTNTTVIGDTLIDGRQVLVTENENSIGYMGCFEKGIIGTAPEVIGVQGTVVGEVTIELVLDEQVGYTWAGPVLQYESNGFDITTTYTYEIIEKGKEMEVNGTTYQDVVVVKATYEGVIEGFDDPFATGRLDYYFAPEVATIRSLFYSPNPFTGELEIGSTIDLANYEY
ncbi:MAG: hypothetical protein AAF849_10645 [Bacteroidota bacterium]